MLATLTRHPATVCAAIDGIEVEALRSDGGGLSLRYILTGDPAGLRLPSPAGPGRANELWRHTCFEAFLAAPGAEGYCELNLSPSGQWAANGFDGYRRGMRAIDALASPRIRLETGTRGLELRAELDLGALTELPAAGAWRLGLSAVIEQLDGGICYWALAHPPGRPDFHHADCFAAELVAPERS